MKVLQREDIGEINLFPGDTLTVTYNEPGRAPVVLVQDTFTHAMVVDSALIVRLDDDEAAALGLEEALGGIIGRRS